MNQVRKKIFLLLLISISTMLLGAAEKNSEKISFFTSNNLKNSTLLTKNTNKVENFKPRNISSTPMEFMKKSKKQEVLAEAFIRKSTAKNIEKNNKNEEFKDILVVKDIKKKVSQTGKSKKDVFIKTLSPIIDEIHEDITDEKERLDKIVKYGIKNTTDQAFLDKLFEKYKVSNQNLEELQSKVIIVPKSLVLAQASLESGWGGSLLAMDANNLFGMKSWSRGSGSYKVGSNTYYKKYATIKDSIYDYILTLSRHGAYKNFRKAIINGNNDSLQLVKHLNSYSELKAEYGRKVSVIIRANNLLEYDL